VAVDESGVPFAPAPDGLLRPHAVAALQDRLVAEGLLRKGLRSGTLDPPTREALRAFQEKRGLPATGLPSYRTVETLKLDPKAIFFDARHPPPPEPPPAGDHGSVGGPTALAPAPR
jgi:peptidoglycan hydrolase-like protein with peptidoglycan-binding domain